MRTYLEHLNSFVAQPRKAKSLGPPFLFLDCLSDDEPGLVRWFRKGLPKGLVMGAIHQRKFQPSRRRELRDLTSLLSEEERTFAVYAFVGDPLGI